MRKLSVRIEAHIVIRLVQQILFTVLPHRAILLLTILVTLAILSPAQSHGNDQRTSFCFGEHTIVLLNGQILTTDRSHTIARSMVIRNGQIVQLNQSTDWEALSYNGCQEVIDLRGRTVIPGLIDSHIHFIRQGLAPGHDVRDIETIFTISDLQSLLGKRTAALPKSEWITVIGGFAVEQFKEGRFPTMAELDVASPQHPVYMQKGFAGPAMTNSAGKAIFKEKGVTVSEDGRLQKGEETHSAFHALKAEQTFEDQKQSTRALMRYANRVGLTTVLDEGGTPFPGAALFTPQRDYEALLDLWRKGESTVRIRAQFSVFDGKKEKGALEDQIEHAWYRFGDDMFRITALGEHVVTFPREGIVNPAYASKVQEIAQHGWSHEQHSVSFEENKQHIAAIGTVHAKFPITDLRWSLAHVFEMGKDGDLTHLNHLKSLGMGVRVQNQGYTVPTDRFPLGRTLGGKNAGPLYRTLVDSGVPIGAGTDGSLLGPMNPWLSIYFMVSGKDSAGNLVNPGQMITRMEALRLYTMGSAWFSFDESRLGSLEPGKFADLVVLSEDYLTVPEEKIRTLQSVLTVVGGNIVYEEKSALLERMN